MNIVAISILSPPHHFVLAHVHDRWPLRAVIQPFWPVQTNVNRPWSKLAKSPVQTIGRKVKSLFKDRHARRLDQSIADLLHESHDPAAFVTQQREIPHAELNTDETAQFIRQLEPDVIVTSGCPLLHRRIFGIARLATINVHWGIAPGYRGEDTLFWPLYFRDYENIGVTLHVINEGIDTGPILAHGFPALAPPDTEATVWAKTAQLTAKLLPEVLAAVERTQAADGFTSADRGRLFCKRERGLRHEAAYWVRQKMGRRSLPETAAHQRVYLDEQPSDHVSIPSDRTVDLINS